MGGTVSLHDVLKARKTGLSPDLYTLLRARQGMSESVITAEPPIYFKSDGTPLSEYQINGDTVQSGTPTPDSPVEILGVGDRVVDRELYGYKIPITLNSVTQNIYLDSPLYEGDYIKRNADSSGVVHRAWRKLVFDGTENVSYNARNDTFGRWVVTIPTPNGTTTPENVICTHFKTVNKSTIPLSEGGICMRGTGVDVVVGGLYTDIGITSPSDSTTIVNAVKSFLQQQYAAGTPVTVIYQLATPTDTPITLPQLSTVKGNNELNINTTVTPEVTLKGKIKQLPDSDMNALLSVMEEM